MTIRPGGRPADDAAAARYRRAGWWGGRCLLDRFESHVTRSPAALALVGGAGGEVTLSRSELWSAAGEAAEKIRGVTGPGRRVVVLLLPNEPAWLVMFLAVLRAGQVPATPPVTTTADHLRHIFELTDPALAISVSRYRRTAPADTVRQAAAGVVVGLAEGRSLEVCGTQGIPATGAPESGVDVPATTAHLMFTSGTTGPPKVVSHGEDSLATLNRQFAERFSLGPETPVFMPSPLGHSVGAIHGARLSMFLGAPLVLQDQWDAATALDLVARHRPAFTAAATPFLFDLAHAPWRGREPKLAPLKSFLCGGAQVPPALIRRCRTEFPNTFVTPLWGMTEGGLTTCVADSSDAQVETTVGVGLPGLELRTLTEDMRLETSGAGELVMRGPGVFNGYYGQPETYARHLVGEGFFRTRRPGPHRCGRLRVDHRPGQGPDHPGRREHLSCRVGERHRGPSGRGRCGGHRLARRAPRRASVCRRRDHGSPHAGRYPGVLRGPGPAPPFTGRSGSNRSSASRALAAGKIRKHELRRRLLDRATAAGGERSPPRRSAPGTGPMSTVELGDLVVHYRRRGSGPAVVLLHGLAEDHRSWDAVAARLGGFTTYAVDLRGTRANRHRAG